MPGANLSPEDIGRWINVSWADEIKESYATAVTVVSRERNGLIMDIASIFNTLNTKVRTINARDTGDKSIVNITLETSGIDELTARGSQPYKRAARCR